MEQNYLVFIPTRYIDWFNNDRNDKSIESRGSAGISEKSIKTPSSGTTFSPTHIGDFLFGNVKFTGICLKEDSMSFLQKK